MRPAVVVTAPPSKSMSHRAVIAAALAPGRSVLDNVLASDDLTRTMGCLTACGAAFQLSGRTIEVAGLACRPLGGGTHPADLDVHESGTTCRLLTAVAAAGRGRFRIHGAQRMHDRPIQALATALASQGVSFVWEGRQGYPPFVLETSGLPGGTVCIDMAESSQYLSGLLLAAPCAFSEMTIELGGDKVVSWPYVALTLQTMEECGVDFRVQTLNEKKVWTTAPWRAVQQAPPGGVRFTVTPGPYASGGRRVEGDWSNASYFLAAGALGSRPVTVAGLRRDSLQGDRVMVDILAAMGAEISWKDDTVEVAPPATGELQGIDVDMAACPDIVPTVAVVAAFAATPSRIRGAAHLRIKECDRLQATANELGKTGADVQVLEDGLRIFPAPAKAGGDLEVTTYGDHRMAMSMSLLKTRGFRPVFDDPGCVGKSFPGFWDSWAGLIRDQDRSSE